MTRTGAAADSPPPAEAGRRGEDAAARSAETHPDREAAEVLAAMVDLVTTWSSMAMQARIARRIGLEINEADVRTLHTIGRLGGAARPARLADELHLTRPTMSKSLARLAAAGLTERRAAPDDRRSAEITLTPAGGRAYERLVDAGVEMVRAALAASPGTDPGAITRFTRALREHG